MRKTRQTYRPTSNAGDAMGENSVVIWKMPSNLRSGYGAVTSHETRATTLYKLSITLELRGISNIPRLAQSHIGDAILIPKCESDVTQRVERAPIYSDILPQRV